jgi:hypothetical protein
MSASVQQMADRVAELMEARLRIQGGDLSAKVRRGGRRLPRRVLAAAQLLAASAEQARSPKLLSRLDPERVALAYDTCVSYLKPLGAGKRRIELLLRAAVTLLSILAVTALLIVAVLAMRGYF